MTIEEEESEEKYFILKEEETEGKLYGCQFFSSE
jgi:hypothetical protein